MEWKFSSSIGIIKKVSIVQLNKNLKVILLEIFIGRGKRSKRTLPGRLDKDSQPTRVLG